MKKASSSIPVTIVLDGEAPVRRRFFRLRWLAGLTLLLIVFAVGARQWLMWRAQRRLARELEALRAAGFPTSLAEFYPPSNIPDDRNAAVLLTRAGWSLGYADGFDRFGLHREVGSLPWDAKIDAVAT